MERLDVTPGQCVFVGDHPEWDLAGPRSVGMEAILLDRRGSRAAPSEKPLRTLEGLAARL
jgi:FMN phosphatase YigB (HAD superfamily)